MYDILSSVFYGVVLRYVFSAIEYSWLAYWCIASGHEGSQSGTRFLLGSLLAISSHI